LLGSGRIDIRLIPCYPIKGKTGANAMSTVMEKGEIIMPHLLPSMQEWSNLYQAAIEFKKIECWDWMEDSDLFGVQNPETGEIGYCCVLGGIGEFFGLAVYLGSKGLEGYLKIRSGEISPEDFDTMHSQDCLMASFDDRKFLKKPDLQIIKSLQLSFRGSNAWPLFRRYEPGYEPWYINRQEAIFLTLALEQAKDIALRFKTNIELLDPPIEGRYLVRVPNREKEGLAWRDEWLKPTPFEKKEPIGPSVDEIRLKRIKKAALQSHAVLETDFFYPPFVITEGEKPYFPYLLLCVDHRSGLILKHHIASHEGYWTDFQNQILNLMEGIKSFPKEIWVKKEECYKLLEPIASELGIKLSLVENLPALEDAKEVMQNTFLSGRFG
jgi:hypothetical protein